MDKPLVIFICGMPGTRKSSTAVLLAAKLNIKVVIGTDQIRDIVKLYHESPFLKRPTHSCWELIGKRTPANITVGYLLQSGLIKRAVMGVLKLAEERGENMILEGVHLDPYLYTKLKENPGLFFFHFLLWTDDKKLHSANIAQKIKLRKGKEPPWSEEKLEEIREIQAFLLSKRNPRTQLIKSTTPEENAEAIIKALGKLT